MIIYKRGTNRNKNVNNNQMQKKVKINKFSPLLPAPIIYM